MVEPLLPSSTAGSVVLDIGGDIGALVLRVSADLCGAEIDLDPVEAGRPHTHSAVRERRIAGASSYAAVYPGLLAGSYTVGGSGQQVTIEGGAITEVDYER